MVSVEEKIDYICDVLAIHFFRDEHEDFIDVLVNMDPNLFDIILNLNARANTCDLIDKVKETLAWFQVIYKMKRFHTGIDPRNTDLYVNFTLRNVYDVIQFEIILSKLLYLYHIDKDKFCLAFETLPKFIYDKIDDLRETSFKSRDSNLHKRSLIKTKFISFEYFNNLKNYDNK